MSPETFRQFNQLDYASYQRVCETYPHIASFAYWQPGFHGNAMAPEALQAASAEEYQTKLAPYLQKGVVALGLNFGVRKSLTIIDHAQSQTYTVAERLAHAKQGRMLGNQYGGGDAHRAMYPEFVTHNGQQSLLCGAYMTDLFKFSPDEDRQWLASGIATKDGNQLAPFLKANPELVTENIEGLQHELNDVLGVSDQFIMVLLGKKVQEFKPQLQAAFPHAVLMDFPHYGAHLSHDEFVAHGRQLNEAVADTIAKW